MRLCVAAVLAVSLSCSGTPIAPSGAALNVLKLSASLQDGSLAGTNFPVTFSYDPSLVAAKGQTFVGLKSFDFTLGGIAFHQRDINQGGQVIFVDGAIQNVTASFQGTLPPGAPVKNITFGFGGPGVIGYIDLAGQGGRGTFALQTGPRGCCTLLFLESPNLAVARLKAG